jgi:hypothetical protein
MSQDVSAGRGRTLILAAWVGAPVVALGVLVVLLVGKPTDTPAGRKAGAAAAQENFLATARSTLAKPENLHLAACKAVVGQLNNHLLQDKDHAPPRLSASATQSLRADLGLGAAELDEIDSPTFTPLDGHHLEACFLFRAAARSLELMAPAGRGSTVGQTPRERAEQAFAWVMRQVRLQAVRPSGQTDPAPPAFALRRGWGTALERALVFIALLEQFDLDEDAPGRLRGTLVYCPGPDRKPRLWACGVAVGTRPAALFLFDPRLGLPVPGPRGEGVATLAQASADTSVLGQLRVDEVRRYDVTAAQAKEAEVYLVPSLSALAPRMALLQDRLLREPTWQDQVLPPPVPIRVAADLPAALAAVRKAVGRPEKVRPYKPEKDRTPQPLVTIQQQFLPRAEGGIDTPAAFELRRLPGFVLEGLPAQAPIGREALARLEMAPWRDFPEVFRGGDRRVQVDSLLGASLHSWFNNLFVMPMLAPGQPRDHLLRGLPEKGAKELVKQQELEQWPQMRQRLEQFDKAELARGVNEWIDRAVSAFADLARTKGTPLEAQAQAQAAQLWKWKPDDPIAVLLLGLAARDRAPQTTFQLALCKHETAARLQARYELAARGHKAQPDDAERARDAWRDAESYWKEFVETYTNHPDLAAARRLRGEALAHLGQTKEAAASWQTWSEGMTPEEKLAGLWLARRVAPRAGK